MAASIVDSWIHRLEEDLFGRTIPFWMRNSVDPEHGGFFNCLDETGEVWDTTKHIWLQGRQCWMWAKLANTYNDEQLRALVESNAAELAGMRRPKYSKAKAAEVPFTRDELIKHAKAGVEFLLKNAVQPNGHVLFAVTRDGRAALHQRKPFSATFLIMACNEVGRATGDKALQDRAVSILKDVLHWIRTPGALGKPSCEGAKPYGPLNVPMILLNVIMEMVEGRDKQQAMGFMREEREWAVAEILKHYVEIPDVLAPGKTRRVILEFVPPEGGMDASTYDGRVLNPGHAIEAGWFLLDYARFIGDGDLKARALDIIQDSFAAGWDGPIDDKGTLGHPAASAAADAASRGGEAVGFSSGYGTGGMIYFTDAEGFSPSPLEAHMKLWWPQAESMIAFAMAYDSATEDVAAGVPGAAEAAEAALSSFVRVAEWTYAHLVDHKAGEWFGYADRTGKVTHRFKGGPYKGCFHVPRALLFCLRALQKARTRL